MSEPIEWIYQAGTGCAYCKDGLCQRMNQLMENGHSQRSAARVMEDECEGKWKAGVIRVIFDRAMATNVAKTKKPKSEPTRKEEAEETENQCTEAYQFETIAISQLRRIRKDDPDRVGALTRVKVWIEHQLQKG
jgi:hypothetical protein